MKHDFLTEQPVLEADALIPALRPGTRVILNDNIARRPEDPDPSEAPGVRTHNLKMMILFNAGDCELSEWAHLFGIASPGFHFEGGKKPPGQGLWILAATWKGR
ncbi:hypothetical protein Daesc_007284 [Daldinia eschscholtzii]|uniref:O-methyltransferase domain-containing protein n=1 Tax=Daldinia eschscholtzii TaxID=292717 RepID=A0AAX6MDP3_9PEZI